jgi:diguanylate cyclase (GGDEF)-like protein
MDEVKTRASSHDRPGTDARGKGMHQLPAQGPRRFWIEFAVLTAVAGTAYGSSRYFNLFERLSRLVSLHESWQLDEWIVVGVCLAGMAAVIASLRWQLMRTLIRQHEAALAMVQTLKREFESNKNAFKLAATTDKLTGLPNRRQFLEELNRVLQLARNTGRFDHAIMFLDFDRFKIVNDSLGHETGDALLRDIGARMTHALQGSESVLRDLHTQALVARLGGDEFVVLLTALKRMSDAFGIAERLIEVLSAPYAICGYRVYSSASIGVALGHPRYQRSEELLRDADTAMYEAKRTGRSRAVAFDDTMRMRAQRRAKLENDLRNALEFGQLSLVYQPIVSLSSGALQGVEGLLRWQHPEEGAISPTEFLAIAEESDLIVQLGEWVLQEGCRQMAGWLRNYERTAPPVISLNVSRRQFSHPALPAKIQQFLNEFGIPPGRLQIEVAENSLAGDIAEAIGILQKLKAVGVRLAIDDFGVGHSSFASLHQMPVDVLKADRVLLKGIRESKDTAALVHALAVLVHNLGIAMVAEGVEENHEAIALQDLGCQYGQGYLFGKPMSPTKIEAWFTGPQATSHSVAGAMEFANGWSSRLTAFEAIDLESSES